MPADNSNPDQAQNKIALALGRLRGDVMPPITSQAAPRLPEQRLPEQRLPEQPAGNMPGATSGFRAEPTFGAANANPAQNPNSAQNQGPSISAASGAIMSASPAFSATPQQMSGGAVPMPTLAGGGIGNGAGVTPPLGQAQASVQPLVHTQVPLATGASSATSNNYFASVNPSQPAVPGAQPDLLSGVDMGPPPLGADYPRAEESDARRRRNRRFALIGAAVVVLMIAGYWIGTRHHGDVPVIAADATPEKVKPTDQGGMQVPNQNVQVLENMNGQAKPQGSETVLPPPEQPVAPPAPAAADASQPAAPAVTDQNIQVPSVPTPTAPATADAGAAVTPTVPTPEVPATTANAAAPAVPAVPAVPGTTSSAVTNTPAVPAQPATTTTASAASTNTTPATTAAAQPAAKPAANTVTAAPGGKVRVQLAAVQSEAAAKTTWAKLQKQHPSQLGNLSLTVQKVDKGAAGVFYRVQAGPLADKAAAKQVCSALSAAGQACLVAQ